MVTFNLQPLCFAEIYGSLYGKLSKFSKFDLKTFVDLIERCRVITECRCFNRYTTSRKARVIKRVYDCFAYNTGFLENLEVIFTGGTKSFRLIAPSLPSLPLSERTPRRYGGSPVNWKLQRCIALD